VILLYRRCTVAPIRSATTKQDKVMYVVLVTVIVLGLANTVRQFVQDYDYPRVKDDCGCVFAGDQAGEGVAAGNDYQAAAGSGEQRADLVVVAGIVQQHK
jgi:hypothetical protein